MPRSTPPRQPEFDLDAALAELPDKYLLCRDLAHNWDGYDVAAISPNVVEEIVRCTRCRSRKGRYVNVATGAIVRGWRPVLYAEGYLLKGSGHVTAESRASVRRAKFARNLAKIAMRKAG